MQVPYNTVPGFLPGAASLIEQVDAKLLIILRDGTHLVGTLRSYDQFSNMVMEGTVERKFLFSRNSYCEVERGLFVIRGDNVVMLGEIGEDEESKGMKKVTEVELDEMAKGVDKEEEKKLTTTWDFDLDLV